MAEKDLQGGCISSPVLPKIAWSEATHIFTSPAPGVNKGHVRILRSTDRKQEG